MSAAVPQITLQTTDCSFQLHSQDSSFLLNYTLVGGGGPNGLVYDAPNSANDLNVNYFTNVHVKLFNLFSGDIMTFSSSDPSSGIPAIPALIAGGTPITSYSGSFNLANPSNSNFIQNNVKYVATLSFVTGPNNATYIVSPTVSSTPLGIPSAGVISSIESSSSTNYTTPNITFSSFPTMAEIDSIILDYGIIDPSGISEFSGSITIISPNWSLNANNYLVVQIPTATHLTTPTKYSFTAYFVNTNGDPSETSNTCQYITSPTAPTPTLISITSALNETGSSTPLIVKFSCPTQNLNLVNYFNLCCYDVIGNGLQTIIMSSLTPTDTSNNVNYYVFSTTTVTPNSLKSFQIQAMGTTAANSSVYNSVLSNVSYGIYITSVAHLNSEPPTVSGLITTAHWSGVGTPNTDLIRIKQIGMPSGLDNPATVYGMCDTNYNVNMGPTNLTSNFSAIINVSASRSLGVLTSANIALLQGLDFGDNFGSVETRNYLVGTSINTFIFNNNPSQQLNLSVTAYSPLLPITNVIVDTNSTQVYVNWTSQNVGGTYRILFSASSGVDINGKFNTPSLPSAQNYYPNSSSANECVATPPSGVTTSYIQIEFTSASSKVAYSSPVTYALNASPLSVPALSGVQNGSDVNIYYSTGHLSNPPTPINSSYFYYTYNLTMNGVVVNSWSTMPNYSTPAGVSPTSVLNAAGTTTNYTLKYSTPVTSNVSLVFNLVVIKTNSVSLSTIVTSPPFIHQVNPVTQPTIIAQANYFSGPGGNTFTISVNMGGDQNVQVGYLVAMPDSDWLSNTDTAVGSIVTTFSTSPSNNISTFNFNLAYPTGAMPKYFFTTNNNVGSCYLSNL